MSTIEINDYTKEVNIEEVLKGFHTVSELREIKKQEILDAEKIRVALIGFKPIKEVLGYAWSQGHSNYGKR